MLSRILLICLFSCLTMIAKAQNCPPYQNPTGNEFPIMAWDAFRYADNITVKNFRGMREAGFTISLAPVANMKLTNQTLQVAEETGMKVMVYCPETRSVSSLPKYLPSLKNNRAVAGYYLGDEPSASQFNKYKELRDVIYKYDTHAIPFVNLFPMADPKLLGTKTYKQYLLEFIKVVNIPMFSFDNYPIYKKNGRDLVKDNFYENLEIASQVTNETGRPFWAFCLSASHNVYPKPKKAYLMFEAFSALAYGAQGLSYYTYVLVTDQTIKYNEAPIDTKGRRTDVWYLCKDVNTEIQALSNVFLGAKLQGAWHTGTKIPAGTKKLGKLPGPFTSLTSEKTGVLVSHLTTGDRNYLMIVNHDISAKQKITLTMSKEVTKITAKDTQSVSGEKSYVLDAGGYLLFSFD